MTAKKSTAKTAKPKTSTARDVLVQVQTRGDKALTARQQARLDAMEARDAEIKAVLRVWMSDLDNVSSKLKAAKAKYREEIRQVLDEIYRRYVEIENSQYRNDFYRELRIKMQDDGYKIQVNTPDVGLMIRLVWDNNAISAARIHQYSRIFQNAISSSVTADGFRDWIQERTFAEAADEQKRKELQSELEEIRKERIKRARILILRYLEWRETHPFASHKMLAQYANKYVNPNTHLVVMLGTAVRRFDRESDYADIHISHIMPPNFSIDILIIDKWAKYIEPKLELFEAEANELPLEQWAFELEDKLWAFDVAEAEKQSVYWALRQQASGYEDQQEFDKHAKAYKKQRLNASKAVKKAKK